MNLESTRVHWNFIGKTAFNECLDLQNEIRESIIRGEGENTVILTEHTKTFTFGKRESGQNLLKSDEFLKRNGFDLIKTNRGGFVTYHGPGQLVIYPILNLRELKLKVKEYVERLELSVVETLKDYKIHTERKDGYPGVWIGSKKIGSLGIHVKKMVTMHGFALNVTTNLEAFKYVNPCGFKRLEITSMENEGIETQSLEKLSRNYMQAFSKVFDVRVKRMVLKPIVSGKIKLFNINT